MNCVSKNVIDSVLNLYPEIMQVEVEKNPDK